MFRWFTAGESHGQGLVIIVEGIPAGMEIDEEFIGVQLARRQKGYGRGGRMLIEQDWAHIETGVRHGKTMGSPIALTIKNKDWVNWLEAMSVEKVEDYKEEGRNQRVTRIRAGHADLPGVMKYNFDDVRPVLERSSARETASRVAAGALARRFLEEFGISIKSHVISIGKIKIPSTSDIDWDKVEQSDVRCTDENTAELMRREIDEAKEAGDTVGGTVEVIAENVPIGLGSHTQWDLKIDALVAQAFMSINAVKSVSIGPGEEIMDEWGSKVQDVILPVSNPDDPWKRNTNNAGGTEGGMSNGMPLVARFAIKPIATMRNPLPSVDLDTGEEVLAHFERSDVCQVPPAGVIGEAMMALVIAKCMLDKFGGDSLSETHRNYLGYLDTVKPRNTYK
ncbi:MAG: chorismate synthase [SAR202 cluster bacterium]|nr:chorismate synthase [SAR202 cluster bacterium]|tara:strand:- start:690 stop:1871 length:1182 start_codon:yes stop_codon:yes gene_type:complete